MDIPENLDRFYERFGSERFRLQSEMAKDRGRRLLELYYRSLDFIYKTVTTIGIVAGFGFTALGHVNNNFLFVLGEVFLFSAIAFGIWATQKIYSSEIENLENLYSKIRSNFSEYVSLFELKREKALENNLTFDDIQQLQNKDRDLYTILSEAGKETDFFTRIVWVIFTLFVFGGLLLLLSFLSCEL